LRDLKRAAEIHDGDQAVAAGHLIEELLGLLAGAGLIAQVHRGGVEKHDDVLFCVWPVRPVQVGGA